MMVGRFRIAVFLVLLAVANIIHAADFNWDVSLLPGSPIIAFDQANANKEVVFEYNYTGTTGEYKYLEATLFQADCTSAADNYTLIIRQAFDDENQTYTVGVDIDQDTVSDSIHYIPLDQTSAKILFCARVDYYYIPEPGDDPISINFFETVVTITVDLTANFTLEVATGKDSALVSDVDADLDYPVEAYFCNDANVETNPQPFSQGDNLQVCVKVDDQVVNEKVYVEDILSFVISQPLGPGTRMVNIAGGTPDPLTDKVCGLDGICNVNTQLPSKYFVDPSPNDLHIGGMALLAFGTPSARRLQAVHFQGYITDPADRNLQDTASSDFALDAGLQGSTMQSQEGVPIDETQEAEVEEGGSSMTLYIIIGSVVTLLLLCCCMGCCCFLVVRSKKKKKEEEEEDRRRRAMMARKRQEMMMQAECASNANVQSNASVCTAPTVQTQTSGSNFTSGPYNEEQYGVEPHHPQFSPVPEMHPHPHPQHQPPPPPPPPHQLDPYGGHDPRSMGGPASLQGDFVDEEYLHDVRYDMEDAPGSHCGRGGYPPASQERSVCSATDYESDGGGRSYQGHRDPHDRRGLSQSYHDDRDSSYRRAGRRPDRRSMSPDDFHPQDDDPRDYPPRRGAPPRGMSARHLNHDDSQYPGADDPRDYPNRRGVHRGMSARSLSYDDIGTSPPGRQPSSRNAPNRAFSARSQESEIDSCYDPDQFSQRGGDFHRQEPEYDSYGYPEDRRLDHPDYMPPQRGDYRREQDRPGPPRDRRAASSRDLGQVEEDLNRHLSRNDRGTSQQPSPNKPRRQPSSAQRRGQVPPPASIIEIPTRDGQSYGRAKCIPLKHPLPPKFQGDMERFKKAKLPNISRLCNFPEHLAEEGNCLMCSVEVPRKNETGICRVCTEDVWVDQASGIQMKWCKGCGAMKPWAAFGEKGSAAHCKRCRLDRARDR